MRNHASAKKSPVSKQKPSQRLRAAELLAHVKKVAETTTDWMAVFNAVFAPGSLFAQLFPSERERLEFAQTGEHKQLYEILWNLRDKYGDRVADEPGESSGSVVVQMPRALHAALKTEAAEQGVSLNVLCVAKLAMKLGEQAPRSPRRQAS